MHDGKGYGSSVHDRGINGNAPYLANGPAFCARVQHVLLSLFSVLKIVWVTYDCKQSESDWISSD